MHQAAATLDQGDCGSSRAGTHDEVFFPVIVAAAGIDHTGALVNQPARLGEPDLSPIRPSAAFAQGTAGPESARESPRQPGFLSVVERLVDGLVTQVPSPALWVGDAEPAGDLLWAPLQLELLLHQVFQFRVAGQDGGSSPLVAVNRNRG